MLPLKMRNTTIELARSNSHFGSYLYSIIKTLIELALSQQIELDRFAAQYATRRGESTSD
ncbi:MAG: hypothetical protein AABZ00_07215 [Chloroflexota bacterium]